MILLPLAHDNILVVIIIIIERRSCVQYRAAIGTGDE